MTPFLVTYKTGIEDMHLFIFLYTVMDRSISVFVVALSPCSMNNKFQNLRNYLFGSPTLWAKIYKLVLELFKFVFHVKRRN